MPRLDAAYRFSALTDEHFNRCSLAREKQRAVQFRARLREGFRAYGFVHAQDEPVSYLWVSHGEDGVHATPFECGTRLHTDAEQIYIWDCRTHPDHEGRGLYRHGLRELAAIATRDRRAAYIVSRTDNGRSCAAIAGAGYLPLGTMTIIAAGPLTFVASRGRASAMRGLNLGRRTIPLRLPETWTC